MKVIGIIAEYNPFHNGHLYQINEVRKMYSDAVIIALVGTNFTQRGQVSLINKWDKAKICLEYGIDLVVEFPTLYATQASDMFAHGALTILSDLGINTLVFGTESDNLEEIKMMANIQLDNSRYDDAVKKYLDKGVNYPTAMSNALYDISGVKISKPNDLLALSYVKEIIKNGYSIEPVSIKRTNDYHGGRLSGNIASASQIREMLDNKMDINKYVPSGVGECVYKLVDNDILFKLVSYVVNRENDNLREFLTVDEGIENRILKNINYVDSMDELISSLKTKRYTYNKISRMLVHIILGIKKSDNNRDSYIRILGFNKQGRSYLNKVKKKLSLPVYMNYRDGKNKVMDLEFRSTLLYSIIVNDRELVMEEYKRKPVMK